MERLPSTTHLRLGAFAVLAVSLAYISLIAAGPAAVACAPLEVDFSHPTAAGLLAGTWEPEAAAEFEERARSDGWDDPPALEITGVSHVRWVATTPERDGWFRAGVRATVQTWGDVPREMSRSPLLRDDGRIEDADVVECGDAGWSAPEAGSEYIHVATSTGIHKGFRVATDESLQLATLFDDRFGPGELVGPPTSTEVDLLLADSFEARGLSGDNGATAGSGSADAARALTIAAVALGATVLAGAAVSVARRR